MAPSDHLQYDSEHMHKRYWYSEEYRWRHFDDVEVGDKMGFINSPDREILQVIPPQGYAHHFRNAPYPASSTKWAVVYGNPLSDYSLGHHDDCILIARRPGETFRRPVPEDFE